MKDYRLIPQERWDYCLCSVLQAIFDRHGISISQDEIARNLTQKDKGFSAHDDKFRIFLRSNGFQYNFYWYNETPFNEPDTLLGRMGKYDGIIGVNTHVYLLKGFHDPLLTIINPEDNKSIEREIHELLEEMRKNEGCFGLIRRLE